MTTRFRILHHGTTRRRAEAILRDGPNPNFLEPASLEKAGGFSTAPPHGPHRFGDPREIATRKAALFPGEGGAVLLEIEIPEDIVALAVDEREEVRFEPGFGLEELRAAWATLKHEDSGIMVVKQSMTTDAAETAGQCLVRLARERLLGRKTNVLAFVDELLDIAQQTREVRCAPAGDEGLRFELPGSDPMEVAIDANRGKLRMMCARLSVLCNETVPGQDVSLYGGEGQVSRTTGTDAEPKRVIWRVRFMNTSGEHWFMITTP